jgi:predicted Ser/Thr protein kinase
MVNGSDVCPLCGYAVVNGELPVDPALEAIELGVRKELREDFTIERLLGRGGMSVVYVARERELNRQIALKVLPLQLIMGRDAVERFTREAKIAASLDHPHIVPVHRIGTATTFLWYSMKLIRGRSLGDVLAEGEALDAEETVRILEPVASALYHAHQRGVVHRDVKPANVLIDQNGWVAVCDFGVAKAFGAVPLTHDGSAIGTPGYMSPEQCNGRPLDGRSDQYALAIVAYECLTGQLPFTANSLGEIVQKHCTEPPPRITDVSPDLPDKVADAVHRAMSKDPDDRFADVVEFVEGMGGQPPRAVSRFSPVAVRAPRLPHLPEVPWLRRTSPVIWGVAIALALGLGGGWWIANRGEAAREASATIATPEAGPGYLSINASPWGTVFVDGRELGNTPLINVDIGAGQHWLRVERDNYIPHEQTIEVLRGDTLPLTRIVLTPMPNP